MMIGNRSDYNGIYIPSGILEFVSPVNHSASEKAGWQFLQRGVFSSKTQNLIFFYMNCNRKLKNKKLTIDLPLHHISSLHIVILVLGTI